ncbi:MAG: hypothetical protein ACREOP_09705 [Thermodesulfobacteriota bacterium]
MVFVLYLVLRPKLPKGGVAADGGLGQIAIDKTHTSLRRYSA